MEIIECDHIIGVDISDGGTGFLHLSERQKMIDYERSHFETWRKQINAGNVLIEIYGKYTDEQWLRHNNDMFKYCPECGAKIEGVNNGS